MVTLKNGIDNSKQIFEKIFKKVLTKKELKI